MRVTIASQTHSDWSLDPTVSVELRVFALQPYVSADGVPISASPANPGIRTRLNWSVGGPVAITAPSSGATPDSDSTMVVGAVVVESTLDAISGTAALLSAWLFRMDTGAAIGPYSVFGAFFVPASQSSVTWSQLAAAQSAGLVPGAGVNGVLASLSVTNGVTVGGLLTASGGIVDGLGNAIAPLRTFAGAPSGSVNGFNQAFALPHIPASSGLFLVVVQGLVQFPGSGADYTVSGGTLTMNYPLQPGDTVLVVYNY